MNASTRTELSALVRTPLVGRFAERFGMDPDGVVDILKSTAFKVRDGQATDAQMTALMIVADQYKLNPFTKEIYAYPDKQNGIVPVVGVDGWSRIINEHPQLDGIEFNYGPATIQHKGKTCHEWIECVIYRKDRQKPIVIREFFSEVVRNASFATPWDSHPNRMHRHKALIQCARIAFGFAGIYDDDEAVRILEASGAIDAETGEILQPAGRKPEVKMPQARSAPPRPQAPAQDVTDAMPKGESASGPGERQERQQPTDSAACSAGEIAYITKKLEKHGVSIADARAAVGLEPGDNLDGLTRDGFIALKDQYK